MGIKFTSPWWLFFLLPVAGLLVWWWRTDHRWTNKKKITLTVLRVALFTLLIFALAGLQLLFPEQGQTVVFLADQSASLGQTNAVWDFIRQSVETKSPEDQYAVVAVGEEAVVDQALAARLEAMPLSSVVSEHHTDLASGLRLAGGLIPDGSHARVIMISDGEETRGNAVEEAKQLQARGIQVDTVHVTPETGSEVVVTGMHMPTRLFPGEEYAVRVDVSSTVDTEGTLRLYDGNEEVASRRVDIAAGEQTFRFSAEAANTGFHRFRVELDAAQDTVHANNHAFGYSEVVGKPVVLVVEEAGDRSADNLVAALEATNIAVERVSPERLPQQLESYKPYSSIILADVPAFQFGEQTMELIQSAVRDLGVGLVMAGGTDSFGMGGWFRTPIEEALPVHMDIRDKERTPSLALMLVIDKSSSMAGAGGTGKMELAKEAAIRATQMLRPQDQVGVIAFDGQPWWVVEPTFVDDLSTIQDRISAIQADGGTDIYPALVEAYDKMKHLDAKRKHIILLTDGQSGNAPYDDLTEKMKHDQITLSTLAVGTDADTSLLESLAQTANGRYYFVTDDTTIPTIFSKETALATRSFIAEQPFLPHWEGGADWANGLDSLPPLGGYIATTAKERAELVIASPEPDPIAARWSYGLGRSVAWTSDLSGNWSREWIDWPSFKEYVNRMVGWTFPQYDRGEWIVEMTQREGKGQVTLSLGDDAHLPEGELKLTVVKEDLTNDTLPLKAISPGTYRAAFAADEPGVYLLQVSEVKGDDVLRSETYGMAVPYSPEYRLPQNGSKKMEAIAQAGNGEARIEPDQVFAENPGQNWEQQPIAQWCLLLAMLLLPFDIAIRRVTISRELLSRIRAHLIRNNHRPERAPSSETLDRLTERKANIRKRRLMSRETKPDRSGGNLRNSGADKRPESSLDFTQQIVQTIDQKQTESQQPLDDTITLEDRMSRLLAAKNRGKR